MIFGLLWVFGIGATSALQAAEPVQVKFHEVKTLKRRRVVVPSWSDLPRPIVCKLDFEIDENGSTRSVIPTDECPQALHKNAKKSGMKWVFEPVQRDGQPVPARFRVVLKINH